MPLDDDKAAHIYDLIAAKAALPNILQAISGYVEQRLDQAIVSIMQYDESDDSLSLLAGAQLTTDYWQALQHVKIGPEVGTCGSAAYLRRPIVTANIAKDKRWIAFAGYAAAEGLQACWSIPVLSNSGTLFGTLATYYRQPREPQQAELELMQRAAALVSLAFEHHYQTLQHELTDKRFRSLFTQHPGAVFEVDTDGFILAANHPVGGINQQSSQQAIGKHFLDLIDASQHEAAKQSFAQTLQGKANSYELMNSSEGQPQWFDITNLPITIAGAVTGVFSIVQDISQRKHQEQQLNVLQRGIASSPNGVVLADAQAPGMPLIYVNPAFCKLTGYTEAEVLGRNCRFLQGKDTDPDSVSAIRDAIQQHREIQVTLRNYRKDGTAFWNQLLIGPVFDANHQCTHYIGIQQDITLIREQEDLIASQRTHDFLTGSANRHTFEGRLIQACKLSLNGRLPLVVMSVDLDGFRPINDALGHVVGDQLLCAVADRIRGLLTKEDVLARLASDEFAILLTDDGALERGIELAENLLELLSQPFELGPHNVHVSASIGIADNQGVTGKAIEMMHHADMAMYEAKRQGRNTWHWYDGSDAQHGADYAQLRHDLMEAITQQQFVLHYQPILAAQSQTVSSYEALIRWQHPRRGLLYPGDFIPLAEQTGQIVAIGQWVLEQAAKDIAAFNQQSVAQQAVTVAVNISPLQFRRQGFYEELKRVLRVSGLAPELLELEVTESVLMMGADRTRGILNEICELGVQVSIDDFGTGYSSFSYLRDLPVHTLKIDRSFIRDIPANQRDSALVQGMIQMAHQLSLKVVVEGIETLEQYEFMRQHGADYLQGFYFARPAPLTW